MTITIYQFGDVQEGGSGEPIHPPQSRQTGKVLDEWHAIDDMIRGVLVYTTSAVHLRVTSDNTGDENRANQNDPLVPADGTAYFLVQRKSRGTSNKLYIYATADT